MFSPFFMSSQPCLMTEGCPKTASRCAILMTVQQNLQKTTGPTGCEHPKKEAQIDQLLLIVM